MRTSPPQSEREGHNSASRDAQISPLKEHYWVSALYRSIHVETPRRRNLWERIVFLVQAQSIDEAWESAERVAHDKEHQYRTATGETLRWTLQEIERVEQLFDDLSTEGAQVYWEFFERVDGAKRWRREPEDGDTQRNET